MSSEFLPDNGYAPESAKESPDAALVPAPRYTYACGATLIPPNPLTALLEQLWRGLWNPQSFLPKPKQVNLIPYKIYPLDRVRRRFVQKTTASQVMLMLPPLTISSFLIIYSFITVSMPHSTHILGALAAFVNLPIVFGLFLMLYARDVLICDQFGLGTAGRLPLYWSDMEKLSIEDKPRRGKHRFFLKIEGRSGRELSLRISHLYPESIEPLCLAIEKNAPFCRNVSQLSELKRFRDFELGALPGVTYVQLWESLTSKNMELTGFAPLQRGYALQDGRLRVLHQVASGGFSAVYLVESDDGRKYVLKEAILPFDVDEELARKAAEQFEREARILKTLSHPQIAHVYDYFVEQGRKYMLLEYLPGSTLKEIVYQNGPIAADKVMSYALQACALLEFLHTLPTPIVHRDVAPDNLIVTDSGKIFLIDFGSANEFVGNATGTLVGKHAYMAPEQIRGKATPQSDIYSFGQTLYCCLEGGAPSPIKSSQLTNTDTELRKVFDRVIRACTQLEAERRPDNVAEIVTMLQAPFALSGGTR